MLFLTLTLPLVSIPVLRWFLGMSLSAIRSLVSLQSFHHTVLLSRYS